MMAMLTIAAQALRDGLRDRWVIAATLLLAALALALAFMGSAPAGTLKASSLSLLVVSLASLSIFLIPLIALLLSYDAIVGEAERGTMLLLLSYPVRRWQLLLGKLLGHTGVLSFATIVGYGAAGLVVVGLGDPTNGAADWLAFAVLIATSVALGAVFLGLGYLVSVVVRERGTAAGLAIAVWLVFVVLYDMGLLGLLAVADVRVELFNLLLLLNPADAYRLFNLTGFGDVRLLSGLAEVSARAGFHGAALIGALLGWLIVPIAVAGVVFGRREL